MRMHVCYFMRILGAAVRRTAYALHARNLRLRRLHLGYASVPMFCIGILYYKCILYSVQYIARVKKLGHKGGSLRMTNIHTYTSTL